MHILHTVLYTFPKRLTGRIWFSDISVSSFASDWLEEWREFSTPITNPMNFRITSDGQIKVAQNSSTYLSTNEDRYLSATRLIHF